MCSSGSNWERPETQDRGLDAAESSDFRWAMIVQREADHPHNHWVTFDPQRHCYGIKDSSTPNRIPGTHSTRPGSYPMRAYAMSTPRLIKKYPNRRLYDTTESRYITRIDVQKMVIERV